MVQGGYVSPSSAKTLTVSRKSNVLDSKPGRTLKSNTTQNSTATKNNNNNDSTISSSIDVRIIFFFHIERFNLLSIDMLSFYVLFAIGKPIERIDR